MDKYNMALRFYQRGVLAICHQIHACNTGRGACDDYDAMLDYLVFRLENWYTSQNEFDTVVRDLILAVLKESGR